MPETRQRRSPLSYYYGSQGENIYFAALYHLFLFHINFIIGKKQIVNFSNKLLCKKLLLNIKKKNVILFIL